MKKIIIFLLLISSFAIAQNDTTNWNLKANSSNGLFTIAENTNTFYGISAGLINSPLSFDASNTIDTASWELVRNSSNGLYTQIQNRVTLFGKTAGQIKIPLNYNANPVTVSSLGALTMSDADARYLFKDSTNIAYINRTNTFLGDQIFSGRLRTDTLLNVLGALTINDTVSVTGRLNLAQTTFASNDIVTLSTKGYVVGFNSSGTEGIYLNSTADNTLRIRNAGVSTDANVTLGKLTASNDLIVDDATKGLVLKDTQGTPHYWRITVTTLGVLTVTDLGTTIP